VSATSRGLTRIGALGWVLAIGACADRPPVPDWQLDSKSSLDRAVAAYLVGNDRVESAELASARAQVARTGRPALLARVELVRCASRVASLVIEPCRGFEALAVDAEPAERAYAAFLAGRASAADAPLLPETQRPLVAAGASPASDAAALDRMAEPLSKLVGAGVLLQSGRASPDVVARAVEAASVQGWRRPLLAWLTLQLRQAESSGDGDAAARIRRRLDIVAPAATSASSPPQTSGAAPA